MLDRCVALAVGAMPPDDAPCASTAAGMTTVYDGGTCRLLDDGVVPGEAVAGRTRCDGAVSTSFELEERKPAMLGMLVLTPDDTSLLSSTLGTAALTGVATAAGAGAPAADTAAGDVAGPDAGVTGAASGRETTPVPALVLAFGDTVVG